MSCILKDSICCCDENEPVSVQRWSLGYSGREVLKARTGGDPCVVRSGQIGACLQPRPVLWGRERGPTRKKVWREFHWSPEHVSVSQLWKEQCLREVQ